MGDRPYPEPKERWGPKSDPKGQERVGEGHPTTLESHNERKKPLPIAGSRPGLFPIISAAAMPDMNSSLLRRAMNALKEVFFVFTPEGKIVEWNQPLSEVTGYTDEEIEEMHPTDFLPDEEENFLRRHIEEALEKKQTRLESRLLTKQGRETPYEFTVSLLEQSGETLVCGTGRDITERKQAKEELEVSNRKLAKQAEQAEKQAEQIKKQNDLLELTGEIATAANEAESFEEALQTAVSKVCTRTGWPVGHVYVATGAPAAADLPLTGPAREVFFGKDPFREENKGVESSGEDSSWMVPTDIWNRGISARFETFQEVTEQATFRIGESLPGKILETGEPAWIVNAIEDTSFHRADTAAEVGLRGAFAFTVPLDGEIVAVLEFFSEEAELIDEGLLEVMESVGVQLGRVAEREEAEKALRESEEQFRKLAEGALVGIGLIQDGVYQYVNPVLTEMTGYSEEELRGQSPKFFVQAEDWPHVRDQIKRRIEGKTQKAYYEACLVTSSGETRYVEISGNRIGYQGEPALITTIQDVTEEKRMRQEMVQLQEEERRRIGQDLHDGIASQLTGANIMLSTLSNNVQAEETKEDIRQVQSLIQEGAGDVRRLSRGLNPGGLSEGDLPSALRGLAKSTEGGRFEEFLEGEEEEAVSSLEGEVATHLYRIVQEATTNARKYAEASEIEIRLRQEDSTLLLEIEDDGMGFDPSESGKEGLGLRSMHQRAGLLGAELEVDSSPGEGTLVRCRLPL